MSLLASLSDLYAPESGKIRTEFEKSGDGRAATLARSDLVDAIILKLYRELLSAEAGGPEKFCLVALGGFGRRELFPHSDIDLLFLSDPSAKAYGRQAENGRAREARKDSIAALTRHLWDLGLRVGLSARDLAECGELHRDNLEFNVSLLDARYLAGDAQLFARLRDPVIPHLVARDSADLVGDLVEMTRRRHAKHGDTIFHLEPNLKEAPGGLRDFHVACWLAVISELERRGRWAAPEELWPPSHGAAGTGALAFLSAARCFLHYRHGRDDNQLTYELQDQAAALGIGCSPGQALPVAEWMRNYFRHTRAIARLAARLMDDALPARSSLYSLFREWQSRHSSADFAVVRGRIFPRQPDSLMDPGILLGLFEHLARHGLELSREAEQAVERALPRAAELFTHFPGLWQNLRPILVLPHAPRALRAMHEHGVLVALLPEWHAIDGLVIRDFYHRYTVDEHSFMTLQNLHALRGGKRGAEAAATDHLGTWEKKLAEVLSELEQPELLFFALLFHDVGKGMPGAGHVQASLEAVEGAFERLGLDAGERETVRFLIANHLEMSATLQRRDIFDPETVRVFAGKVGTPERLKMLCLFTYADIKAVNPEALTPWKAEMLWQLYASTANYLSRSVDEERLEAHALPGSRQILARLGSGASARELDAFLEGFPRRYLDSNSPETIAAHFEMARRGAGSAVRVEVRSRGPFYELTVVTGDRPFLFASITGTLAAWGMNILKGDAFSNKAGTVLDTFRFVDLFRTLELNPSETASFKQSVVQVLNGEVDLRELMRGRMGVDKLHQPKVRIPTQVRFLDAASGWEGSSHSTLLEIITQDRPWLLYEISSTLSSLGCNIEVALIDTEGQKVIDVFYLTEAGVKLGAEKMQALRDALLRHL